MSDERRHPPDSDTDSAAFTGAQLAGFIRMADVAAEHMASNAEALHDFRVALRYLHSWLQAFADTINIEHSVIRDISSLSTATNPCRDMEVFDQWLRRQITHSSLQPTRYYVNRIHTQLEQERRSSIECINACWPAIKHDIQQALKPTARIHARAAFIYHAHPVLKCRLSRLSDQISRIISAKASQPSRKQLHKCRITIKQMRYLLEPFKTGNSRCQQSLRHLKLLQQQLGACHDLFVFSATLQRAAAQYAGLDTLIASAVRQRQHCFAGLYAHYFTPPMAWLTQLDHAIDAILTDQHDAQA